MADEVRVYLRHIPRSKLCTRGIQMWFNKRGLDLNKFLAEGLPASEIEATNDAFATRVAKIARDEAEVSP